jgi:tRNA modification GTPase
MKDTIFAISSGMGRSGVVVLRISGSEALKALAAFGVEKTPPIRHASLTYLKSGDGTILDKALLLHFAAPQSFTGENILEFHLHGSPAIVKAVLARLSALAGFRPAEPGEFTRRAYYHGKLNLTEAEGLADLIHAETQMQHRQAMRLFQGESARLYDALRSGILEALALLEAYIDFPDEEIPDDLYREVDHLVRQLEEKLSANAHSSSLYHERVRNGMAIAIIGPPNVGKSTLLNRLAQREAAIVSELAGTTRDVIELSMDIGGYAVTLYDTAGIRETQDAIEQQGVRRTFEQAERADILLYLFDPETWRSALASRPEWLKMPGLDQLVMYAVNKMDQENSVFFPALDGIEVLPISALSGKNIDLLIERIIASMASYPVSSSSPVLLERHRLHLERASTILQEFSGYDEKFIDIKCEILRRSANEIGKITGKIAVEEILDMIFQKFCIGK